MRLFLKAHGRYVKQSVEREITWYDHRKREMVRFSAGDLEFRYDPTERRCVPVPVKREAPVWENSWNDIVAWLKTTSISAQIESADTGRSVTLRVNDSQYRRAMHELKDKSIMFEVLDHEDELEAEQVKEQRKMASAQKQKEFDEFQAKRKRREQSHATVYS
jgi:hypothetical protein